MPGRYVDLARCARPLHWSLHRGRHYPDGAPRALGRRDPLDGIDDCDAAEGRIDVKPATLTCERCLTKLQRTRLRVTAPASAAAFPPTMQVPCRSGVSLSLGSRRLRTMRPFTTTFVILLSICT